LSLSDVIQIVKGIPNQEYQDCEVKRVKTDSRCIEQGDLFLGINAGYLYVDEAIEKGAVGVIVSATIKRDDILVINVENSIEALKSLAEFYRNQYSKPVIAITGSVGKTTTKELISNVLSKNRKVLKNEGNKNNIIGISNTLLQLDNSYDCVVLEVGMNHMLEIHAISLILKPTICVITAIGSSHLGNLKSKKNILKAKMEIVDGNKYSLLLLNGEDTYLKKIKGMKCYLNDFTYRTPFKHLQMNYNLAVRVCLLMGMNYDDVILQLDRIPMHASRMNIIQMPNRIIIDDSYNASYESIVGGLDYLNNLVGRKVIILGEILELGSFSESIHKKLIKPLRKIKNSIYFFVGASFNVIPFGYHFASTDDLLDYIDNYEFLDGDVIYVKASRAWMFEKVVDFFKS